jgi:hypothetical protein
MKRIRTSTCLVAGVPVLALVVAIGVALPASAAAAAQKLSVLSQWSQPTSASTSTWNAGRLDRAPWSSFAFDWSTDYCSASPDQPLGFDFRLPCWRHDFGYRNHKAVDAFPDNKSRIDSSFYFDLKATCATHDVVVRPACDSLAWVYYEAVAKFGSRSAVDQAAIDRAAIMKADAETAAASADQWVRREPV